MNNNKVIDAIAPAFTALMIEKIQNLKTGWSKPWVSMAQGCPRNLAGITTAGTCSCFFC